MKMLWVSVLLFLASCGFLGQDDELPGRPSTSPYGPVCGVAAIRGEAVGQVDHPNNACGIADAVRVHEVSGARLSQPALMDCQTARTINSWVVNQMDPIVGKAGGGVVELKVAAHYVCRTRNHKPGAKISEHGKGHAIDFSAFRLRDGSEISVLKDWGVGPKGRILKALHKSACGPFGTVLGPGSDGYHRDHFHFDTARYRSGAYCR